MSPDSCSAASWAGVDVGAAKGFDVALIDDQGLVAGPRRLKNVALVMEWLGTYQPRVIAVDSPRWPAPQAMLSRPGERALRAAVCGIRYTPNPAVLLANIRYYGWILNGFALYAAIAEAQESLGATTIECFPTATWSRLGGPKGSRSRAAWSRAILGDTGLLGLPYRSNQDARDAIGAALTARLYARGETESFGDIVVPFG